MSSHDKNPGKSVQESINLMKSAQNNPQLIDLVGSDKQNNDLSGIELEFKDYIALFIASLQTIFLPIGLLMLTLVAIALIFRFL